VTAVWSNRFEGQRLAGASVSGSAEMRAMRQGRYLVTVEGTWKAEPHGDYGHGGGCPAEIKVHRLLSATRVE
jgi:hypothetical protein